MFCSSPVGRDGRTASLLQRLLRIGGWLYTSSGFSVSSPVFDDKSVTETVTLNAPAAQNELINLASSDPIIFNRAGHRPRPVRRSERQFYHQHQSPHHC